MVTARFVSILLGCAALALASYNAVAPQANGTLGLNVGYRAGSLVATVVPGGPAARAGIRNGDRIAFAGTPLSARLAWSRENILSRDGVSYRLSILGARGTRTVAVRAEPAIDTASDARYIDLALALLYILFGAVVFVKAPRSILSQILIALMMTLALVNGLADYQFTARTTPSAFFIGTMLQQVCNAALTALIFTSIASLPAGLEHFRKGLAGAAIPLGILSVAGPESTTALGSFLPVLLSPLATAATTLLSVAADCFGAAAAFTVASSTPKEQRVRTRWFVSTLALCWFLGFALYDVNAAFLHIHSLAIAMYYVISFGTVGPLYATLRHKLVDIDLVVSRSAIFAFVSSLLVIAFLVAEWLAQRVADVLVGDSRWHGLTVQVLALAAVIGIGLSGSGIRVSVERRVNDLMFRDRARRLRLLQDFAHDADLIESRETLLTLAYQSLRESLETSDVALYVSDGSGYVCLHTSAGAAPERLDKSDRLVLHLLRRPEPFVSEHATLRGWLVVPLMVRTAVTGFFACGPKPDRTAYLADELQVLETLSHHVAMSYALLRSNTLEATPRQAL